MNIHVKVLCVNLRFNSTGRMCLQMEFLVHVASLYLTYWGTTQLFPGVVVPLDIPTSNWGGSSFSTSLPIVVVFCCVLFSFYYDHPSGREWFWSAFLSWLLTSSSFSCACWLFVYLLWRNTDSRPWPTFNFFFFSCWAIRDSDLQPGGIHQWNHLVGVFHCEKFFLLLIESLVMDFLFLLQSTFIVCFSGPRNKEPVQRTGSLPTQLPQHRQVGKMQGWGGRWARCPTILGLL